MKANATINTMQEIEHFLSYLLADRGYSQQTVLTYRMALTAFARYMEALDASLTWSTLDGDVVRRWMAGLMEEGENARTISKKLSALRSFYKYELRMGRVQHDPVHMIRCPKVHTPLPTFLKQSEIDRLFDDIQFPPGFKGLRDRTILLTFYHTGIRVSELLGLDETDVDLAASELKVTGKRNKQRIVPFGNELTDGLTRYTAMLHEQCAAGSQRPDNALFVTEKGKRMTMAQVQRVVRQYLALVTTQKKKSPHVLRHTFATQMLNNGADIEAIKELLGHSSVTTTEVYTHTTFADLKKQYKLAHPRA